MDRVLVVTNPVAGRGRAPGLADRVAGDLAARGLKCRVVRTTGREQDDELDAAILAADAVIAIGGDGTLIRVARPIVLRPPANGHVPAVSFLSAGTGNVATRAFGFPRPGDDLAGLIAAGNVRRVDAGVVRRDGAPVAVFLLWLGAGVDAAAIHAVAAQRGTAPGRWLVPAYAREAARTLMAYPFPPLEVRAGSIHGSFAGVMVANVGQLAVGSVARQADSQDGHLNVVAVGARSRASWAASALLAAAHAFDRCRAVSRCRATRVQLLADTPVPVHVDGEPLGSLPLEIEVRPAALPLLTLSSRLRQR